MSLICFTCAGFVKSFQETAMFDPNTDFPTAQPPLPLFRPEVLASHQHKFFGHVLLIRPFSGSFFIWLALALAVAILGIFLLGHYLSVGKPVSGPQSHLATGVEAK